jgi:hypothetical protein
MTLPDILQDARAFAAACEELAEHLDATAARLEAPDALETLIMPETAFVRVLPLMCAFASPDAMAAFAARLRAIVARLDALPASADELARVMAAPADEFAKFEALLFGDEAPQECGEPQRRSGGIPPATISGNSPKSGQPQRCQKGDAA